MPYWKDAPSVKPEVFLSLSAPFRLLRADHYRLGRVSCYNIETSAGLAYAAPAMRWRAADNRNVIVLELTSPAWETLLFL